MELAATNRDNFLLTLEDSCRVTVQRLRLAPLFITHVVTDMVGGVSFSMSDCASLAAGARVFLCVAHMAPAAENMCAKVCLWDNVLRVNVWVLMAESSQLLSINITSRHVYWVMAEAALEGLADLLATLCSKSHPLVLDLLSLVCQNSRERRVCIDWAAEYDMLPIYFLFRLSLYLNTWFISVEE